MSAPRFRRCRHQAIDYSVPSWPHIREGSTCLSSDRIGSHVSAPECLWVSGLANRAQFWQATAQDAEAAIFLVVTSLVAGGFAAVSLLNIQVILVSLVGFGDTRLAVSGSCCGSGKSRG